MTAENDRRLSVDEAADILAVSAATVRRYCRQEKLSARKVPSDGQQDAWAITRESVQALAAKKKTRKQQSRTAAGSEQAVLTVLNSALQAFEDRLQRKALQPSEAEQQQRARIARGLTDNAEIIRDLAAQVGRLEAERDRLHEELEDTRAALEAERAKTWLQKLTGKKVSE